MIFNPKIAAPDKSERIFVGTNHLISRNNNQQSSPNMPSEKVEEMFSKPTGNFKIKYNFISALSVQSSYSNT